MRSRDLIRLAARDGRAAFGRFAFSAACLGLGVAAVVSVSGMAAAIEAGIRSRSQELLAADLEVRGHHPIPDAVVQRLAGEETAAVWELPTMIRMPEGGSSLVELKAVQGAYPFYGRLAVRPPLKPGELLADQVIVAEDLRARFALAIGDTLAFGGQDYRVVGVVDEEPDRVSGAFTLGPRIFVSRAGLERSGLERFGSRIDHRLLVRAPGQRALDLQLGLRDQLVAAGQGRDFTVETAAEARPGFRRAVRRVERFLALVALISLWVAGIGVASAIRAWLAERLDAIAYLRCLGFRAREVAMVFFSQALALGLVGSALGALLGTGIIAVLPRAVGQSFPFPVDSLPALQPAAILRGVAIGLATALLFAAPPLLSIWRVPALRVLRRDLEPLPAARWTEIGAALFLLVGLSASSAIQTASLKDGALLALGLAAAVALLMAAARGATAAAAYLGRTARPLPLVVRQSLRALSRPGRGSTAAVVALGAGCMALVALLSVERRLDRELGGALPSGAPTAFFLDVQPDQWESFRALLVAQGASAVDSVPVVMARLRQIDGRRLRSVASIDESREDWARTREQRLTWLATLPKDNQIVAGALWSDPAVAEASLEEGFARDLGVGVGARLTLDVQGVPIDVVVTSLRRVEWRTFGINFFIVIEPGVLEQAPHFRLVAAQFPASAEGPTQDAVARQFPNVTVIVIRTVLEKAAGVLRAFSAGVRVLGAFTLAVGTLVLAGAVAATSARRARESALWKTLGATRAEVAAILVGELAWTGGVAGVAGAALGALFAVGVGIRAFELDARLDLWPPLILALATMALAIAAGLGTLLRALSRPPLDVLRDL